MFKNINKFFYRFTTALKQRTRHYKALFSSQLYKTFPFLYFLFNNINRLREEAFYDYLKNGVIGLLQRKYLFLIAHDSANNPYFTSMGFPTPKSLQEQIWKNIMAQSVILAESKIIATKNDRINLPMVTEAEVRHPGEWLFKDDNEELNDETLRTIIPIHVELVSLNATTSALEDPTFSVLDEIVEAYSEAVAVSIDQLWYNGNGQNKIAGMKWRLSSDEGAKQVIETSEVTPDHLKTMLLKMNKSGRQNAKWYMNSNTGLLIATLKDVVDGRDVYLIDQRDESLRSVGVPDRLLGRPIVYNEWMGDVGIGEYPIILADLHNAYGIGLRPDITIRRFDDSSVAEKDQTLFLGRFRLGADVYDWNYIKALKIISATQSEDVQEEKQEELTREKKIAQRRVVRGLRRIRRKTEALKEKSVE